MKSKDTNVTFKQKVQKFRTDAKALTHGITWISKKKALSMFATVLSISALVIAYMVVIDSATLSIVGLFY